jgi:hypothetical protein
MKQKRDFQPRLWIMMWLALLTMGHAEAVAPPSPLPAEVRALDGDWQLQGSARFRKYLINVYDGHLWVSSERFDPQGLYALDLTYALAFKAKDLAARSVEEMRRIGGTSEADLQRWGGVMHGAFPDLKTGDRLVGVNVPGRETRFYLNDKLFSTVPDPAFGPAFFAIWLHPRTSEPAFRRELLAGSPPRL